MDAEQILMHLFATTTPEQALELGKASAAVEAPATQPRRLEVAGV
jgi:hypothetical protein